ARLPVVGLALLVFFCFLVIANLLGRVAAAWCRRLRADPSLEILFHRTARWSVILIGAALSLTIAVPGFTLGSVVTGLGFGGVAIGFAFKDLFENYLAGLYFLIARPFTIGNWIRVDTVSGIVETISTRSVNIRTFDRELEVLPCSTLFKNRFTVVDNEQTRRFDATFTIPVSSDIEKTIEIVLEAVAPLPGIVSDPPPFAVAESFSDLGIVMRLYYFLDTEQEGVFASKSRVTKAIRSSLSAAGILSLPATSDVPQPQSSRSEL
ncbi:MAG: mechanosensitive ion channel family protein, partial [Armatimonadetes bacterium]|nr:mechanosensitive ion channel family protein [Armatimonadota bacterium]